MAYQDNLIQLKEKLKRNNNVEFAKELGIPYNTLTSYLGGREPSVRFVGLLVDKLNINANWFLTGKGEMLQEDIKEKDLESEVLKILAKHGKI